MILKSALVIAGLALAVIPASVDAMAKKASAEPQKDSQALDKYNRTGQFEKCLPLNRIQHSRILNDHQILFEMTGGDDFLNEPKSGCPSLSPSYALTYETSIHQLCNTQIVRLIEPSSSVPERGACNIAQFERLTKK